MPFKPKLKPVPFSLWDCWFGKHVTISALIRQSNRPNHLRLRDASYKATLPDLLFMLRVGAKVVKPISPYGLGIGRRS